MNNLTPDTNLALLQASQVDASQSAKGAKGKDALEKASVAAQELEAVFIAEMMKPMFQGLSTEAPFGGGKGEEVFQGMLLQEYGKIVSQTGSIGITDQVRDEMIRMQAQADKQMTSE
jgi:flagellar protein FlgJ